MISSRARGDPWGSPNWAVRWVAAVCVAMVAVGVIDLRTEREVDPVAVAAQSFADAQADAFSQSESLSVLDMTPAARSSGLPYDATAGLSWTTTAGPVRMVLPAGLGNARTTRDGQVVYPDVGSGFDFLVQNTPTGTRTVARIDGPSGVRSITTFLRTTSDVVMLAHTNGFLTLNRTTPAAETVEMFSPSEARDANGRLVPSSYVVRQYGLGLYQLSEVIAPTEKTTWPVYVDPPISVAGPGGGVLPQFGFSSITSAISGAADVVAGAATAAASATVSGVTAVGAFVRENPLESAMIVGGVALSLTGVGGPAGAAVIAAAAVNVSSTVVDVVAAHNPDNAFLGDLSTTLSVASMITPQGATKKIVGEGLEVAITQAGRHVDEIVDVAKAVPTPPAQLAEEVANSAMPKIPNAPPGTPDIIDVTKGTAFTPAIRRGIYDDSIAPNGNLYCSYCGSRIYIQEGRTAKGDVIPPNRAQIDHYIPRSQGGNGTPDNGNPACMACNGTSGKGDRSPEQFDLARGDITARSQQRIRDYEAENGTKPNGVTRTPNDRSASAADQQRNSAQERARQNNSGSSNRDSNGDPGSKTALHHRKRTRRASCTIPDQRASDGGWTWRRAVLFSRRCAPALSRTGPMRRILNAVGSGVARCDDDDGAPLELTAYSTAAPRLSRRSGGAVL